MKISIAYLSLLLWAFELPAAVVVAWSEGPNSAGDLGPAEESPAVTTFGVSRGPGILQASGGTYNSRAFNDSTSAASAMSNGDFLSWGFTIQPEFELDMTTLDIAYDRSGTGPTDIELQYSFDAFSTSGSVLFTDTVADNSTDLQLGVDLSGLVDLSAGTTVTFRLLGWGASGSTGTFDIENRVGLSSDRAIVINADIIPLSASAAAAPEPGTSALLFGGLGLLHVVRRFREIAIVGDTSV